LRKRRRVPGLREKEQFWWRHFEEWRISGLGQREYCKKHDIILSTFTLWRRRLKVAPEGYVEIVPVPAAKLVPEANVAPAPPGPELPATPQSPVAPAGITSVMSSSSHPVVLVIKGGQYRLEIGVGATTESIRSKRSMSIVASISNNPRRIEVSPRLGVAGGSRVAHVAHRVLNICMT
jgi:hypothetical protein